MSCMFLLLLLISIFEKVEWVVASKVQFKKKQDDGSYCKIFLPLCMANTRNASREQEDIVTNLSV